ncbi:Eukaryotic translation initiation factor 4E type 3-A [Purpureocillium lavendulum]|uniref:Eukaryotic translation initiation factor 4E type 3-A n=1 Tax=Purpureocillium lavendulum TaxID=1247861 RepID=A0AB34FI52_9HYPO|nr:Eukaryotic translation initiation factor 4E type 3-A [Purpureocillium lavendulum]
MEEISGVGQTSEPPISSTPASHRRAPSGSSLLARLPFLRPAADAKLPHETDDEAATAAPVPAVAAAAQQHKTRRRRGSLRKVALLGRGAQQRERRDSRSLTIDTSNGSDADPDSSGSPSTAPMNDHDALGLKLVNLAQSPPGEDPPGEGGIVEPRTSRGASSASTTVHKDADGERSNAYTSTTDEEDGLQMGSTSLPPRTGLSTSSGSESHLSSGRGTAKRRRSFQQTKSPLSYSGISTNPLPPADSDWDYAETEWWGWVVLTVTWVVFVIGMGSCLEVWKWAWDVGKTPYAPPEFEDDETLPIIGYYPALIILTGVMAWVWVVVAWVGMKYFRHAKISGD